MKKLFNRLLNILGLKRGMKCACGLEREQCIWWKIGSPADRAGTRFSSQEKQPNPIDKE